MSPEPTEVVPTPSSGWKEDAEENQKRNYIEQQDAELQLEAEAAGMELPTPTTTRVERERVESELDAALAAAHSSTTVQHSDKGSPLVRSPAHQKARTTSGPIVKKRGTHMGVRLFEKKSASLGPQHRINDYKQKNHVDEDDGQ